MPAKYKVIEDKTQAFIAVDIDPLEQTRNDREVTRVSSTTKARKNTNGWIIEKPHGTILGNWEVGHETVFCPNPNSRFIPVESRQLAKISQLLLKRKQLQDYTDQAKLANEIWHQSTGIDQKNLHPYLAKKRVLPVDTIREITANRLNDVIGYSPFPGRILICPLKYNTLDGANSQIVSIQFISEDGQKRFLKGARKSECYWQNCKFDNPALIAISEGIATVLSVIEHSQLDMVAVSAMDAGNLPKVARVIHDLYPTASIIIYGDNDVAGCTSAKEAVESLERMHCDVEVRIPEFTQEEVTSFQKLTNSDKVPTDWNDYYIIQDALDAIRNEEFLGYDEEE